MSSAYPGAFFESIVDTVREPQLVLNPALRIVSANQSFYSTFQTSREKTEGELVYKLGAVQWDIPQLRELLEEVLPKNVVVENHEVVVNLPQRGRCAFLLNARRLEQLTGAGALILLALVVATRQASAAEQEK